MTPLLLLAAALGLPDLQKLLLANNPELKQAEAKVAMAEGMARQAGLYPNPSIGASGEHVTPTTRYGAIGGFVEQRVVTGGKLGIAQAIARQDVATAKAERDAWRLRLNGQLTSLYWDAVLSAERTKTREQLAKVAADSAKIARELRNTGVLDEPDVRMADVEAQRAEVKLIQARQMLLQANASLAALLNQDALSSELSSDGWDELPALEQATLWSKIKDQSPEFAVARSLVTKAELSLQQAKRNNVPDLKIRGGLRNNNEITEYTGRTVGTEGIFDVSIEIPIFNRQQGAQQAAKADIERTKHEAPRTQRSLQTRFAAAWQMYETARQTSARYRDDMIPSARQSFQMYQRNFRAMQAQYPLVLSTQRSYFELQDEYLDALRDARHAIAQLESLLLAN